MGHALAVVRSVYPSVKLKRIDDGFAQNLSDEPITALEEEVSNSAIKLANGMDLFGDASNDQDNLECNRLVGIMSSSCK